MTMKQYVIGVDFGSDSVRAVLVDASCGETASECVCNYPRWAERQFCDSGRNAFRHHPLDYIESLRNVIHGVLDGHGDIASSVRGIGVDATGSTPCLVDRELNPLSLRKEYASNPDAMFVLWKDHSAIVEAAEIEASAGDFLNATSGKCSPEYFWPKLLHVLRHSPELRKDAYSFMDLCTWMPNWLCGNHNPEKVKITQSLVASKFFEDPISRRIPPAEWFASIDDCWLDVVKSIKPAGDNGDEPFGLIDPALADEFGLPADVVISCGMLDGFCGAVGSGVSETRPVVVLGTSLGYLTVSNDCSRMVRGAFSQGVGQILPGMFSVEMGLSAYGDIFAWFAGLLNFLPASNGAPRPVGDILRDLGEKAAALPLASDAPIATDFLNGRRSPDIATKLTASIMGLRLGTGAPEIYRALLEASCFGIRAIVERMSEYGMSPEELICIGGISQKSPYVMQMLADVIGVPLKVSACLQSCALGAAMCAATASGLYPNLAAAQKGMAAGILAEYVPDASLSAFYDARYRKYCRIADFSSYFLS